jgi:hypothetical protein
VIELLQQMQVRVREPQVRPLRFHGRRDEVVGACKFGAPEGRTADSWLRSHGTPGQAE